MIYPIGPLFLDSGLLFLGSFWQYLRLRFLLPPSPFFVRFDLYFYSNPLFYSREIYTPLALRTRRVHLDRFFFLRGLIYSLEKI